MSRCAFCKTAPIQPGRRSYCSEEHARLAAREKSRAAKRELRSDPKNRGYWRDWWQKNGGKQARNRYFRLKMREYRARKRQTQLNTHRSHGPTATKRHRDSGRISDFGTGPFRSEVVAEAGNE